MRLLARLLGRFPVIHKGPLLKRRSGAEDASISLLQTDYHSLEGAIQSLHDQVLASYLSRVTPRDERFILASTIYHRGRPGMRARSNAARQHLRTCADDLLTFCHGHARSLCALRTFAGTHEITMPELPDHVLLQHLDDVRDELVRPDVSLAPSTAPCPETSPP